MTVTTTDPWDVKPCSQTKFTAALSESLAPSSEYKTHPKVGKLLPDCTALLPRRRQAIFVRVIRKESHCAFVSSKREATRISTVR